MPAWLLIAQYMPREQWMNAGEVVEAVPIARRRNGGVPYDALRKLVREGVVDVRVCEHDRRRREYRKA